MNPIQHPLQQCQVFSSESPDFQDVWTVSDFIKPATTPEAFDNFIQNRFPDFNLAKGGRCGCNVLGEAAIEGNERLVRHIVARGGPNLVNLGNAFGWTPVYCAIKEGANSEGIVRVVKTLIRLGANVNMSSRIKLSPTEPANATPLWEALKGQDPEKGVKNMELLKVLIKNGAVSNPPPDTPQEHARQQALIDAVKLEIKLDEKRQLLFQAGARKNPESILSRLPADVRRIIFSFIKS